MPSDRRPFLECARLGRRLLIVAVAFVGVVPMLGAQSIDALLPIQRILIKPERAAKEMEKVQAGGLVLWPLAQFEGRLERVRKLLQARDQVPTLTRASYHAELIGRSLTNGRGQWVVQHAGADPGLLPMEPLNLALHKSTWEQGGDAVLAEFDGKTLGLLVKHTGTQICYFDWSARGTPINEGITFKLAVPPCALTTFEFKLLADQWLFVPKNLTVLTGPHEDESPNHRIWKLQATGQTTIDLTVRKVTNPKGPSAAMFARVHSVQTLAPDRITLDHDFQLDILHGSVQKLTLETDAALQPFDVALKGSDIKSWQWTENAAKKDAKGKIISDSLGVLTIEFHQPVQGRIQGLRVKSIAARPSSKQWTSPAWQVRDAHWRGETLHLHLSPNVQAGKWDAGTFQHLDIKSDEGTQILMLADTADSPTASRRPSLTLERQLVDAHTTERYTWHVTPRDAALHAEIEYALTRGSLFEFVVQMPKSQPSYPIESLELRPADLLKSWHLAGDLLVVELKQAFVPGKKAALKVQMRAHIDSAPGATRILHYPELEPKYVGKREGTVGIRVEPTLHAQLLASSLPPATNDPRPTEQGQAAPSFLFTFRNQRLSASIRLVSESVQTQWRGKHLISLTEADAKLRFRWDVEPVAGAPEFLDLRLAPNFPSSWKLLSGDEVIRVHHWERLPLEEALPHFLQFGAMNGLHAAVLESALPVGSQWRFYLAEPLRKKGVFGIEAATPAGLIEDEWRRVSLGMPNSNPWEFVGGTLASENLPRAQRMKHWMLPLAAPMHGLRSADEVVVQSPFEPMHRAALAGSRSTAPTGSPAGREAEAPGQGKTIHEAAFTLDSARPRPELALWTRAEKRTTSALQRCDEAVLATYLYNDGRQFQRIEFTLWHWRERTCELWLPAGYQIVEARIQGQTLERLDVTQTRAGVRLVLPIDQTAAAVRCEIFARAPAPTGLLFGISKVELPSIEWPAPPMSLKSRLFIEDGLAPLDQDAFVPVGVPARLARPSPVLRGVRHIWTWGLSWLPFTRSGPLQEKLESQKQIVLAREQELRAAGLKPAKLSRTLERLAFDHLGDSTPLFIDALAFRELGLDAETPLPPTALNPQSSRPFWEALGLTYLPCSRGALLTSAARLRQLGIYELADVAELDAALDEAILHGQDSTSGFYLVLTWLNASHESGARSSESEVRASVSRNMTEWKSLSGDLNRLTVIDTELARYFGCMFAILALLVFWRLQRSLESVTCFRVHLLLITASILVLMWLPVSVREAYAWPSFLIALLACLWTVGKLLLSRARTAQGGQSTISSPGTIVAGILLVPVLGAYGVLAQPSAPRTYTVLIIDGAKPSAILTPDLIAKLDELDNLPPLGTQHAVLVSAKYTGKVNDSLARFEAQYDIHSFKDKVNLLLPLAGVQLHEDVFLDGAPVFPSAQKNGYTIPIRDKGTHRLRFTFTARVTATADHAELKFTIPKVIQNEFSLRWPAPVQTVHVLHGWGAEERILEKGQAVKEIRAQLGHEGTVHVRWTGSAPTPGAKGIDVKEAHLWDLRPGSLGLTSSFQYSLGKNALMQLTLALPEELQVRAVDVLAAPQIPAAAPLIVKGWQILGQGAQRRLVVDFAQPVSGSITLNLEIHPRLGTRERLLLLPLPGPLQSKSISGLVGYRLDALELRSTAQNLSVQGINSAEFDQLWKKQTLRASPTMPTRAYSFQRKGPQAGLVLAIQPEARQARFHLDWTVDVHHADLRGKFTVSSPFEDITRLDFTIDPAVTLADIVSPDVARWTITDTTLQVWLRAPRKQVTLELLGWRTLPYKANLPAKASFILPVVYPLDAQTTAASVQIHPVAGLRVDVDKPRRMRASAADARLFTIEDGAYGATFWLRPDTRSPDATLLTKISAPDGKFDVWHGIRVPTERGMLAPLQLHVRNWGENAPVVEAPGAAVQRLKDPGAQHGVWSIKYPPGQARAVFITIRHQGGSEIHTQSLPIIELKGLPFHANWVAWNNADLLEAESGKKLLPQPLVKAQIVNLRATGPYADQPDWSYADRPRSLKAVLPKSAPRSSVSILSAAEEIFLDDRLKWTHALTMRIHAPEAAELRFRFPAEVAQFSAFDGRQMMVTQTLTPSLAALVVEARTRPREILLRWQYVAAAERTDTPNLGAVQVEPAALPMHARRLWVAHEWHAGREAARFPTLLGALLDNAAAHSQTSAVLARDASASEDSRKTLLANQQDFYASIRQAEYSLGILKISQTDFDAAVWRKRIDEAESSNAALAAKLHFERVREEAKKVKRRTAGSQANEGSDLQGIPWLVLPERQLVPLRSAQSEVVGDARTRSEWLLLGGVFLLLVSYFRRGMEILRSVAPEIGILAILALMAWQGLSVIGLALLTVLLLVRLISLAKLLKRRLHSPVEAEPSQGPTVIQTGPPTQ